MKLNWKQELEKWLVRKDVTIACAQPDFLPGTDVVIINPALLPRFADRLAEREWDCIVADECHEYKNLKAQRTQALLKLQGKLRLALSGTPMLNRISDMFTILNWLDPVNYPSWWRFVSQFAGAKYVTVGVEQLPNGETKEKQVIQFFPTDEQAHELQKFLRSTVMIRRMKKDVLADLPPKTRQVIEVPDKGNIYAREMSAYQAAVKKVEALRAAVELSKASENEEDYRQAVRALRQGAVGSFAELSALRREAAQAAIPINVAHINDLIDAGVEKILVFAHHREVVERLHNQFLDCSVLHYGGLSEEVKWAAVKKFQEDPTCRILFGSLRATGVGLNLTAAKLVLFVEEDWVPGIITQCEDRAWRYGQTKNVLVQHLVVQGSLSAYMAKTHVAKQTLIDKCLDKDRETLANEPVLDDPKSAPAVSTRRHELAEAAKLITPPINQAIHQCLKLLAEVCDGARTVDMVGFNGVDAAIGRSLANAPFLTQRQAALGQRIITKYKRQLPEGLYASATKQ